MPPGADRLASPVGSAMALHHPSNAQAMRPGDMLSLQRSVGNRAVQDLIAAGGLAEGANPRAYDGKPSAEKGKEREFGCGEKCGGKELGSTECALDDNGLPLDRVAVFVKTTDPCITPCVEVHENVHAKTVLPVCKAVHSCLKAAGNSDAKQAKCLDTYESDFMKTVAGRQGSECKAYTAEAACLEERKGQKECKGSTVFAEHKNRVKCYMDCHCRN